jgi:hypothetical protein
LILKKSLNVKKILPFFLFPLYVLLFGSIRQKEPLDHYYYLVEPAIFYISSYAIITAIRQKQSRIWKYLVILLSCCTILSLSNGTTTDFYFTNDAYKELDKVSDQVIKLNKQLNNTDKYALVLSAKYDWSWESPTIWYFLEKKEKRKIVNVINREEGLVSVELDKSWNFILVCKDQDVNWQDVCVANFIKIKPGAVLFYKFPQQGVYLEKYAIYFFHP